MTLYTEEDMHRGALADRVTVARIRMEATRARFGWGRASYRELIAARLDLEAAEDEYYAFEFRRRGT